MNDLDACGYRLDLRTGVWMRPDYQGLDYSDGETQEQALAQVIAQASDVSLLSEELAAHTVDWMSLYHLGRDRANILRPFEARIKGQTVLEIGAGCGAVSRYLGECGASVLSVEGSLRRAQIAASRTRDLDNVTVLAERFELLQVPQRFSVVTLVGVLEYASLFSLDAHAALNLLRRVRERLEPDGLLVLAIENQLGLKYFAGAPEDHLGKPMYGLEGRYRPDEPRTFGRQTLQRLLADAGFTQAQFMVPLPDYKLTRSIVSEQGFAHPGFDAAALAWQSVRKDPQLPARPLFNLERVWPEVIDNGLGLELANAFVVAASCDAAATLDPRWLAFHYNTGRIPAFCKQTCFIEGLEGIEVHSKALDETVTATESSTYRHRLMPVDGYRSGQLLSQRFMHLASNDWSITDFAAFIVRYVAVLRSLLQARGIDASLEHPDERLPGVFLDAVAHNIVLAQDGQPALIDIEWEACEGVTLGHLLVRALLLLIAGAVPFNTRGSPLSRRQLVGEMLRLAGFGLSDEALQATIVKEANFQSFVSGRPTSEFLDWKPDQIINQLPGLTASMLQAKLYYGERPGEFCEARSLSQPLRPGLQTLRFPLVGLGEAARWLRLDPVDQPVWFSLNNLRLLKGADREVWRWDGHAETRGALFGAVQLESPHLPALFASFDDDPRMELPLLLASTQGNDDRVLVVDLMLYTDRTIVRRLGEALEHARRQMLSLHLPFNPLTEFDTVTQLIQHRVGEGEYDLGASGGHLSDRPPHDERLEQRIERLEREQMALQIEKDTYIHQLNLRIHELERTSTRRLAMSVRQALGVVRRTVRATRQLPALVQRSGGLRGTVSNVVRVVRQQGVRSLLRRLIATDADALSNAGAFSGDDVPDRHDYAAWVRLCDTLSAQERQAMHEHMSQWSTPPLISVIMPVFKPPLELLRQAIDSVQRQMYPHWELCIADDASHDPAVDELLVLLQSQDPRIKVMKRTENGHISRASNSALELATGAYIALLDQDDLLAEQALYWVVRTIIEHPEAGLIYSDEDKIDLQGQRSAPYFKCDWNAYLFRSHNLVSHLGVYRRSLVEEVGHFRPGFEGAQDYDLALRCSERLTAQQIVHISKVLYHWRIHAGSTARAGAEKPYAALAGVKALDEHLRRTARQGWTQLLPIGMYRVHYQLPEVQPLVSVIIPTRNAVDLVRQCIESILQRTTYRAYEILLVDNGSDDGQALRYFAQLERDRQVRLLRDDGPFNYSALNNRAAAQARGEILVLLNNDIEVISPHWLDEMVALALQPEVGAVGACLWFADDRLQHGGVILGIGGVANHAHKFLPKGEYGYFGRAVLIQEFSAVTAACLAIRKSVFGQVGGLDEVNLKVAFNDVDFCLRLREAGYVNVWTPYAELYHYESATRGVEDSPEKQRRFNDEVAYMTARWPEIRHDYAYNANLTLDSLDFGLSFTSR